MMQTGAKSYWSWARYLNTITGETVSKQAIFKRMKGPWVKLVKALLAKVMNQRGFLKVDRKLFRGFNRVLLQDSTTLHLPEVMLARFKGNVSRGEQKSVAKINVVLDVIKGCCPVMKLMDFTVNEQSLAESILSVAKKGDLVIRDLGYHVLSVFRKMDKAGIYFLSRLKFSTTLYDATTGEKIVFAEILKGKCYVDIDVLCGSKEKLKVRLVAKKLTPEQAAARRRKAKKDRDRRLNHSEDYYAMLDYVILITNVPNRMWNHEQVAQAYRVRWNIEILFKSWKGGFRIEDMMPDDRTNTARIEGLLYLLLLYITWFQLLIFIPFRWAIQKQYGKHLSIIKTTQYVIDKFTEWFLDGTGEPTIEELAYYCCYDKRRRPNASEDLEYFFNPLG